MIDRAVAAGVPARWVTADAVYGSDYHFRATAEQYGLGYVVGVRTDFAVWAGFHQVRVGALLGEIPADAWQRLSCGDGSKGPRLYDWAVTRTTPRSRTSTPGGCRSGGASRIRPRWRTSPAASRRTRRSPIRSGSPGLVGRSRTCSS